MLQIESSDAYAKLVDRLLASPHYGERWGQHWLDVVRFAEIDGFEYDTHRKDAWRYRDYVIRAFKTTSPTTASSSNSSPATRSTPKEDETLIAAGFNRLGPLRKNAGNQEVASSRNEVLTEMTNIVGAAFLGVTLGCARCHDHKFDPIRQSDYYRMQAFFAAVYGTDVPARDARGGGRVESESREPVEAEIKELAAPRCSSCRSMPNAADQARAVTEETRRWLRRRCREPLPSILRVAATTGERSPIHLLARGDYQNKGDRVGMRPLGVLLPDGTPELPEDAEQPRARAGQVDRRSRESADRARDGQSHLAISFRPRHRGTPNDFGRMGERPTHPELLDYLANEFVASGWSVKHMHRLILISSAYRQSSALPADAALRAAALEKDPDNKLLWQVRTASGWKRRRSATRCSQSPASLNGKQAGRASWFPIDQELVNALYKPSQWAVTKDADEHSRRSIYLIAKRNLRLPFMEVFDAPDRSVSCPRRESSTHAPQALNC